MSEITDDAISNTLFAARLKSARMLKGWSLQDLANSMNNRISRQALHKYEKGDVLPDTAMIAELAATLGVARDYFTRSQTVELGTLEFRKQKKMPVKEQAKIVEHTKDVLSRYLELEELLGIQSGFQNPLASWHQISSFEDVEKASVAVRNAWCLGADPIYNAIELLEDNHIKVVEAYSEDSFDGMQTWVNGSIPVIVVNMSHLKAADRIRFTVLHELAHLLLPLSDMGDKEKERYCHRFAAAMLFPKETAVKELGLSRTKLLIQELGVLKQQYGISIQALLYRANDLGIISDTYVKQFILIMTHNQWRVHEPIQYTGVEKSNRFQQLLFRALAEEVVTIEKAAKLSNSSLTEFRKQMMIVE